MERFAIAGTANRAQLRADARSQWCGRAFCAAARPDAQLQPIAPAVEIQGPDEERRAELCRFMRITR